MYHAYHQSTEHSMTLTHITLFISQSGFIDIKVGSSALAVFYS